MRRNPIIAQSTTNKPGINRKILYDTGIIRQGGCKTLLQRLNVRTFSTSKQTTEEFNQWLVGFTDGDGTFTIESQKMEQNGRNSQHANERA